MIERDYLKSPAEIDFRRVISEGVRRDFGEITISKLFANEPLYDSLSSGKHINLITFESSEAKVFIVPFSSEVGVVGQEFVGFLNCAVPSGRTSETYAVQADWDICIPEVRAKDPEKASIYEQHSGFGPFAEFEANHFNLFWEALQSYSVADQEKKFKNFGPLRFRNVEWLLAGDELEKRLVRKDNIISLVVINKPTWYGNKTLAFFKEKGYFGGPPPYIPIDEIIKRLPDEEKVALFCDFGAFLDVDSRRFFAMWVGWEFREGNPGVLPSTYSSQDSIGTEYRAMSFEGFSGVKVQEDILEFRFGNSFKRFRLKQPDAEGFHPTELIDEKFDPAPALKVVPALAWGIDKNSGGRRYYCGKVDDELMQTVGSISKRHDFLFGQSVALGLSRDVRQSLVPQLSFTPGGKSMLIRAAQLVATLDFYSAPVLKHGRFISWIEELAK